MLVKTRATGTLHCWSTRRVDGVDIGRIRGICMFGKIEGYMFAVQRSPVRRSLATSWGFAIVELEKETPTNATSFVKQ